MNGAAMLLEGRDAARTVLVCRVADADGTVACVTYGELRDRVARAAAAWLARGLEPGAPVAVKLPDGIDWVVAWLGVIWAGGVAVGVNPRVPAAEWRVMREEACFAFIVEDGDADTDIDTDIDSAGDTGTGGGRAGSAAKDNPPPRQRLGRVPVAEARQAWQAAVPCLAVTRHDEAPAFWVHSSGSSGRPKAVVHAQRTLRSIADVSTRRLGIVPADRLLASSRLFFTYPLVNSLLAGLAIGATVLLDPTWPNAASLAASVNALAPTVLFTVPSLYRDLLHEGHAAGLQAAGVRLCVSAGEALPARLGRAWRDASGLGIVNGYGTSETLVLVLTSAAFCARASGAGADADDADDADDGEGHNDDADHGMLAAAPGVLVRPLDAAAASRGEPTRLVLRAPTLALGYHDRPAAAAESFMSEGAGLAFCPADLFVPAGAGRWRFAGREDSLVKLRGRWVDLVALEQRLMGEVGMLREAALARVADADGVEAVALFFVADDPEDARVRLAERIAALPPHQRPTSVHALPALPRTGTGKLLRRELAARAAAALAGAGRTASAWGAKATAP